MKDVDFFIFSFECKFPDREGEMKTHHEKCFAEIRYLIPCFKFYFYFFIVIYFFFIFIN